MLNIDPGKATNRTVMTFAGTPEAVVEAAFRAVKRASELIDMSKHRGEHPRFGATDVCPLVPLANISMEETVVWAKRLAERIGNELDIPVYCYEYAASTDVRRSLANCRSGEYEGLAQKLTDPAWKPDFGPAVFNVRSGAIAVGARNFLIAYNVNINSASTRWANGIANDLRESGRIKREGDPLTGKIITDENGQPVRIPGKLKKVRAIGWFIEEYGIAQVSMNLTDLGETPLHVAFDAACESAETRGIRVTGSELIGLVPLQAMLDAGKYFLRKQRRSTGIADAEIIRVAVKSLGLDDLTPFDPKERIIEYVMEEKKKRLKNLTVEGFAQELASESPAPGGGSVAANVGALGAALGGMVANLSAHKRGWDDKWETFSDWAEQAKQCQTRLIEMVDADTQAFGLLMNAFGLPKTTDEEKTIRTEAIQAATVACIRSPLAVMHSAFDSMAVLQAMAEVGLSASVSDAGVGVLCAKTAVHGAYLNVLINLKGLTDAELAGQFKHEAEQLLFQAEAKEQEILKLVYEKIG